MGEIHWRARWPRRCGREALVGLEIQRDAIDAVALKRRCRTIGKNMPEMAAAVRTMHFGPAHPIAAVFPGFHCAADRQVEARPTSAALELRRRDEKRLPASSTEERAATLFMVERATVRCLCAMPAHNFI